MTSGTAAAPVGVADATTGEALLPLTEAQRSLLLIDRMLPARQLYNLVMELELSPAISTAQLRAGLATVLAVQPALRQTFRDLPSPHAVLSEPPAPAELAVLTADLADLEQVVQDLSGHLFDLGAGPLHQFAHLIGEDRAVLLVVVHHMVFDGMSLRPLIEDLNRALRGELDAAQRDALRASRERALRREQAAEVRIENDPSTAQLADRWAEELRDRPSAVFYPRPHRPAETSFDGTRLEWEIPAPESALISDTCKQLQISAYEYFTACYGVALARHSSLSSAIIGSPFLARRTVGSFELCGFFVNTLPIHFDLDWSQPFAAYASGVVKAAVDRAKSRVQVPFSQVVARLRPDRSSNRNPLFSCMLAMQDQLQTSGEDPIRGFIERGNGTAKFDLWLGVWPVGDHWRLAVEYDHELLPAAVAEQFVSSLSAVLVGAGSDPATPLDQLFQDSSAAESVRTDECWVPPAADNLIDWIELTAADRPEAIAVETPDEALTYRLLLATSRQVAAGLRARGVAPGDVVGVCPPDLTDTTVAILAILRCGAAYLPLEAGLPTSRLQYMVDKTRCSLIIGEVAVTGAQFVTVDELTAEQPLRENLCTGDSSAYVMFSSGSTGSPKGIEMGGGPLLNLTAWQLAALEMDAATRFLQYAPLGFDVSFQEIVPTLAAGGTVIARGTDQRADFPAIAERLADTATSHIYLPVAGLVPFVQAAGRHGEQYPHLRYICVSGEQLMVDGATRQFFQQRPHLTLVNLYGPTETHAVTTQRLSAADAEWPVHVPIGLPITGVAGYLVDVTDHLAPAGVQGELYLGGKCPAKGYLNEPELTARGFVADRFAGTGTMYRTGDQALRDEHGRLVFLGRADEQVKIRGYRVELGEVEAAAHQLDGVRRAVAAARETGSGRELVLFTVGDVDGAVLRPQLATRLPEYALPARYFSVEAIPTTVNGKVDRAALLREAELSIATELAGGAEQAFDYRDDVERELAAMWSELLQLPRIERERSLLDYGAHSLLMFTALSRIRQRYGATIPIRSFFKGPTVAALAENVRLAVAESS